MLAALSVPSWLSRRRTLRAAAAFLVVLGLLLWWLLPFGTSSPHGSVTFSTGVTSGVYQRYGTLLKNELARDLPDVSVALQTSEGSQQNISRVAIGEADVTIATADAVAEYQKNGGTGADRLRGCARLYDDYVQLIVPKDSEIHSIRDLRGKRVGVGQQGSGVRLIADRLLKAVGLDSSRSVSAAPVGIDTAPGLIEHGQLDAFFWSGGLPTLAVEQLSERFDIRLVPLEASLVTELHATGDRASTFYRSAELPADAYPRAQNGAAIATVAVSNLLVTTDRMDPSMTEALTRAVIDSRDRIGHEVHPAQLVDLRTAIYTDPLPLHEGAKRYYRSVKP
ncbi:TAXI family TRAP transporter solute-binding subunit [Streptomyces sp. NPDC088725]|uniref:TAXI family TRAP transporter solute-binding subunit n=1 Tax=Streptomyces sp. NPDC088725 TaxID=3365873 RepID=UPI00382704F5